MSPHAHLARSPVGLADKVWLEAVGREPGENSPWYRSHVLAQRPKLASETLIPQEWLNLALSDATAAAVKTLRAGAPIGKLRLGCDVGEGVGRSQSVIVVRDDLGVLEIFANQFESKAETAHAICGLVQKWQIGLEGIIFDGNGNTGRDILRALERLYRPPYCSYRLEIRAGLTHHNSESGLAGKPCLLVKSKLLDHILATFR
jgi:hypothetical protein